jgi:hypothetical protein
MIYRFRNFFIQLFTAYTWDSWRFAVKNRPSTSALHAEGHAQVKVLLLYPILSEMSISFASEKILKNVELQLM